MPLPHLLYEIIYRRNDIYYFCTGSPFESQTGFTIRRPEEYGGDRVYATFEEIRDDFAATNLHPGDLKSNVERYLNVLLDPIRKKFQSTPELQKLLSQAYPPEKPKASAGGDKLGNGNFFPSPHTLPKFLWKENYIENLK